MAVFILTAKGRDNRIKLMDFYPANIGFRRWVWVSAIVAASGHNIKLDLVAVQVASLDPFTDGVSRNAARSRGFADRNDGALFLFRGHALILPRAMAVRRKADGGERRPALRL